MRCAALVISLLSLSAATAQVSQVQGTVEDGPCLRAAWLVLDNGDRFEVPSGLARTWKARRVTATLQPLNRSLCGNAQAVELHWVQEAPALLDVELAVVAADAVRMAPLVIEVLRRWPSARVKVLVLGAAGDEAGQLANVLAREQGARAGALLVSNEPRDAARPGLRARAGSAPWEDVQRVDEVSRIAARAGLR
jgi:hypothetical protein